MSNGVLRVDGLTKVYDRFTLDRVSFDLEKGSITGFIGRNGAGKSTTLKCIMGLVAPTEGDISIFGGERTDLRSRAKIGYVNGGFDVYLSKKLKAITEVTRNFYPDWDENAYRGYLREFALDESKTVKALSTGMRVKYSIALALSHGAKLIIMDEPTSGLDPVSREEILDLILELKGRGVTVLFSTHIVSDIVKVADRIIYLRSGKVVADSELDIFVDSYKKAEWSGESSALLPLIGTKMTKSGFRAIVRTEDVGLLPDEMTVSPADAECIMIHMEV